MARLGALPNLIVFARAPRMGRVKSRLARDIGAVRATLFYRQSLMNVLRIAHKLQTRCSVQIGLADRASEQHLGPSGAATFLQVEGDIGERMLHALCAAGSGPAVLVGSDVPDLKLQHITEALTLLRRRPLIFGPARDGGFWLVGVSLPPYRRRRVLSAAFQHVRWSTSHALEDVLHNLDGTAVATRSMLNDVDTGRDYADWLKTNAPTGAA